jgi:hypothetical protein
MRFARAAVLLIVSGLLGFAQVTTTARLDGTVTDPQGAAVPGAQIVVVQVETGQSLTTSTDEKGHWALPSLQSGTYKVTVTHEGFKSVTNENVKIDAGVPATVNLTLQVGAVTETVEVTAGAEVLQTDTATVASTLQGRQIHDLPFTSHNVTELIATQPGTQTGAGVRYSTINGLPQPTINITIDGVNVQDNATRSNPDAVFNAVQPRTEAIEEMTVTTAAAGADSMGEGAVQIKFVTKSGSNTFHGGLFETNRNAAFEANYVFNGLANIPKDRLNLNEFGGSVGGPVKKNKLFFFESFEAFRLPQSFNQTGRWLSPAAAGGAFTYKDSSGVVRTVNLFQLAAAANASLPSNVRAFPTAPDPILAKTYALINQLTSSGGTIISRIATNNDYNTYNFTWGPKAVNNRNFETARIDYNITDKHHLNFVWNYQTNLRNPDGLNGTLAILPGTGTIIGSNDLDGQFGIGFTGSIGLRSVITPRITNELTAGLQGGRATLGCCMSPADFAQWKGNLVDFRVNTTTPYMNNPYTGNYTGYAPRTTPVYQLNDNVSYQTGNHLFNFGFNFTQISAWQAAANSSLLPTATLGQATGDPDNTGATSLFTTANFPGASAQQLTDAASLYALIAGRVASTTSSAVLNEQTKTYGPNLTVDRNHQREFAAYVQDSWRLSPSLTLNAGVRWDRQNAINNLDSLYTRPGYAGLWGVSGVGNLFAPGVMTGSVPVFTPVKPGDHGYDPGIGFFSPTIGIAYRVPKGGGILHWLTGDGNAVLRGGFNIATNRQGIGFLDGIWSANQGRSLATSTSPSTTPSLFPAGGVLFSDPSFPVQTPTSLDPTFPTPSFPLAVQSGQTVSDYNPSLKPEYIESWTLGFQRELGRNTVIEARYVGNHGVGLWRTVNLNEVNIIENGFLKEFQNAQNNLAIANGVTVAQLPTLTSLKVTNFGNTGLPGQVAVPILQTALGTTTDTTTANQLAQGQAGATANAIATNSTRMSNLTKAGYPLNFFQVNPLNGGNANMLTNANSSTYNSAQIEVRRRLASGLQLQGSYAFAKSLTNANNPTLRNIGGFKGPTTFDIRHGIKATWVYQLPFGHGRPYLSGAHGVFGKVIEGWEIAGVGRLQSGTPMNLLSGRATFNYVGTSITANGGDGGVVLHNITQSQLQSMMHIYETSQVNSSGVATGTAWYLPQSLVQNTLAAFQLGGTLDPNAPYIGPCTTAGQICNQVFLWGPWLSKWDISMVKRTQIKERLNVEFRAQALNIFNHPNILLPTGTTTNGAINTTINNSFGQTTAAFRDFNNTNDPGSRTLEFVLRVNF